jgi:hypothetical protein
MLPAVFVTQLDDIHTGFAAGCINVADRFEREF